MENELALDLLDLIPILSCIQSPTGSSFEERKRRFDFLSFLVAIHVEVGERLLPALSVLDPPPSGSD